MCVRTLAAIVLLTLLPSTHAFSDNDDELFVDSKVAMVGRTVIATVADPSAAWYNPAGLALITVDRIDASGTAYSSRSHSIPTFMMEAGGQSAGASVVEFVSVPSQVSLAHRLSALLILGVGDFAPQDSELVLREFLDMQVNQTRQRIQVTLSEQTAQHAGVLALGLRTSQWSRFGFSAIVTLQDEVELFGVAAQAQEQGTSPVSLLDTQLTTTTFVASELDVGRRLDVGTRYHLGLALRSPRL